MGDYTWKENTEIICTDLNARSSNAWLQGTSNYRPGMQEWISPASGHVIWMDGEVNNRMLFMLNAPGSGTLICPASRPRLFTPEAVQKAPKNAPHTMLLMKY
jgi:hypothetical protein